MNGDHVLERIYLELYLNVSRILVMIIGSSSTKDPNGREEQRHVAEPGHSGPNESRMLMIPVPYGSPITVYDSVIFNKFTE